MVQVFDVHKHARPAVGDQLSPIGYYNTEEGSELI